jgi:hypothetical protein
MSSDRSVYDLFDRTLLQVPDYQRGYAWELPHLEEFWEDLSVLPAHAKHYTGTVVLHPRGEHDVRDDAGVRHRVVDVVDGQQRLTSVVLLLNELRRRLAQVGAELEAQKVGEQYVWIRKEGRPQAVLTLGRDIDPFWQRCVLADQPPFQGARLRSEARLLAARRFFEARLDEISRSDGASSRLRELYDTVTDRLRFTLYEVDDQAQVGVIFETLNDRGKPLTELEKAKNYLLFLASGLEPGRRRSLSEEVNTTWAHVYERLMEADITDPREEDRFLRAHWLMAIDPVRRNWDGTASLKSRFPRQRYWADPDALMEEVGGYVRELADAARAFCDTRRPTADGAFPEFTSHRDEVRDWSERLRRVGALASFTPLLLAVRLRHRGDAELYREVVELCEKFAFRVYRLRGVRANSGQGRLFSLAYDVYTGTETADSMLHRLRDAIAAWSPRPMFEREFEALGDERNWYAWAGLRYFLYEYERALTGRRPVKVAWGEVEQRPREETIEHILPQSPREGEWLAFDDEARKVYTHDLGNLVLTFDNSSYSNKAFLEKRDGKAGGDGPDNGACFARSPLLQEQRIAGHLDWTPKAVLTRRSELIAWAHERWAVEGDAPLDPEAESEDVEDPAEELDV